jgi:vanillate O-demethylase monooxygenase subunit
VSTLEHDVWPALRAYWHPVAYASEVSDRPHPVRLLGERLVVARLADGLACFRDLCVHRATALSLGWIEDGELVCAYHGWRYDGSGRCTRIPALPEGRAIPERARIAGFGCVERYGLVWVCLGEPVVDVPEYPEFGDPAYRAVFVPAQTWQASAARATENSIDAAHFPWLHEGILGTRDHPEVPDIEIEEVGEELRYDWLDLPNPMHPTPHRRVYRLHRPFTIHQRKERDDGDVEAVMITACPRAAEETTIYLVICRNFELSPEELEERMRTDVLILEQDRPVVESQRPAELPLDLSAEMHIRGADAVAVAYRRFIARLGVEDGPTGLVV